MHRLNNFIYSFFFFFFQLCREKKIDCNKQLSCGINNFLQSLFTLFLYLKKNISQDKKVERERERHDNSCATKLAFRPFCAYVNLNLFLLINLYCTIIIISIIFIPIFFFILQSFFFFFYFCYVDIFEINKNIARFSIIEISMYR